MTEYNSVKNAANSDIYAHHQKLIAQIASERAHQRCLLKTELCTEYFNIIGTLKINWQHSDAVSEYFEPQSTYILKKRQCLTDLLCQSSDSLNDEQLTLQQKFQTLQNLMCLCSLHEVFWRSFTLSDNLFSDAEGSKDAFHKYSITCLNTQYLFCLSDITLCYVIKIFFFLCQNTLKSMLRKCIYIIWALTVNLSVFTLSVIKR